MQKTQKKLLDDVLRLLICVLFSVIENFLFFSLERRPASARAIPEIMVLSLPRLVPLLVLWSRIEWYLRQFGLLMIQRVWHNYSHCVSGFSTNWSAHRLFELAEQLRVTIIRCWM